MHKSKPSAMRITCGQRHYTCGWTAENPASYTQPSTHNPYTTTTQITDHAYNPIITHIPHTVFTQPFYNIQSVNGCLYTLSTFPTNTTIKKNNI